MVILSYYRNFPKVRQSRQYRWPRASKILERHAQECSYTNASCTSFQWVDWKLSIPLTRSQPRLIRHVLCWQLIVIIKATSRSEIFSHVIKTPANKAMRACHVTGDIRLGQQITGCMVAFLFSNDLIHLLLQKRNIGHKLIQFSVFHRYEKTL